MEKTRNEEIEYIHSNRKDFGDNYLLRDYSTDRRAWGLINAYSKDGSLHNIRIIGKGNKERIVLYGEYLNKSELAIIFKSFFTSPFDFNCNHISLNLVSYISLW